MQVGDKIVFDKYKGRVPDMQRNAETVCLP